MRYLPVGLRPDLVRGPVVVGFPVRIVVQLVGEEILFWRCGQDPLRLPGRSIHPLRGVGENQLCPVRAQRRQETLVGVCRNTELHLVAARGAEHRVGDAGVARGRIDDGFPGTECAASLSVQDHRGCRPVLHRAAGIHPLGLGKELDLPGEVAADAQELQKRSVADAFKRSSALHRQQNISLELC